MSDEQILAKKLEILKEYIEKEFKNPTQFCKEIGFVQGNWARIAKGERPFKKEVAENIKEKILNKFGFNIFAEIENPEEKNTCWIKEYSIILSAGNGNAISDEDVIDYYPFDLPTIRQKGWHLNKLAIFQIKNESMMPKYSSGIKVLVDRNERFPPHEGKVYAIRKNNEAYIKRLFKEPGTTNWIGKSDNRLFDDIPLKDGDDVDIIGLVVLKLSQEAD